MSNIGWPEIAIVVVLILVIFGPKKLPGLVSSVRRSLKGVKKGPEYDREEITCSVDKIRKTGDVQSTDAEPTDGADRMGH
jgi:sec-independent protein translocase protein TatA